MDKIERMQRNLLLIRRTVGWTAEEFGEKVGVSRQEINLIETGRHKLSKTLYLAIRNVLDSEIKESPRDTEMLYHLLKIIIDHPENHAEEYRDDVTRYANIIAPSILAKSSTRKDVSDAWILYVNNTYPNNSLRPIAQIIPYYQLSKGLG